MNGEKKLEIAMGIHMLDGDLRVPNLSMRKAATEPSIIQ